MGDRTDPLAPSGHPQRAIIVAASTAEFDSRTHRLASTLAGRGHDVTVLARAAPGVPSEENRGGIRIRRVSVRWSSPAETSAMMGRMARAPALVRAAVRASRVALAAWAQAATTSKVAPRADVVHAMAVLALPTAFAVARRQGGIPVVYDARDLYPDAANVARLPGPLRRLFGLQERRWARQAALVVTVNDAYADVLERRLGPPRPLVVMNGPPRTALPELGQRRFHDLLGLAPSTRVVLYHGGFSPQRGIEQLIEALGRLGDDTVLVLMGYGRLEAELRVRAADPGLRGRLHVLPAVPPEELLDWVASADVAAMPIQPSTLNHRLTTPNKLYEAMAAGVPVVAADLPGMARIVRDSGCGILCDPTDPAAIAAAIDTVLSASPVEHAAWGEAGRKASAGRFAWEAQVEPLLASYARLTGRPW